MVLISEYEAIRLHFKISTGFPQIALGCCVTYENSFEVYFSSDNY